jgi:hypothetical protein
MAIRLSSLVLIALPLGACAPAASSAGAKEAPAAEKTEREAASAEAAAVSPTDSDDGADEGSIPQKCHREGSVCTANPKWVSRLCSDVYPDVALYLFRKSSPFTHGWLTRKTKAVNASGGVTSGDEYLAFDEEVVLLYHRAPAAGGIQVSGAEGGFDGIRADGSCVTLDASEVTLTEAPKPKYGHIEWRHLGDDTQDALKQDATIRETFIARKKECKGAYSGDVSKKCVQLDDKLNSLIIEGLKSGSIDIPVPAKRP